MGGTLSHGCHGILLEIVTGKTNPSFSASVTIPLRNNCVLIQPFLSRATKRRVPFSTTPSLPNFESDTPVLDKREQRGYREER